MAGSPQPVPDAPKLGMKATIVGLVFVITILTGFGVATAVSFEDSVSHDDDHGEEHGEDGEESHDEE